MMAGLLKDAGYRTAGFAGGGFLDADLGFGQGFDTYTCKNDQGETPTRRGFRSILPQAENWLSTHKSRGDNASANPFFLFLHTYDIHCPYWPKPKYRQQFSPDYEGPLDLRTLCGRSDFDQLFTPESAAGPIDLAHLQNMYDGGIAMTDDLFGQFMNQLRDDGVLENTMVIVTSDHGESLGEHQWVGHNHMWEEQLRVPLMIRFPDGAHAGQRVDAPTMLVDILPTVLSQLQLPTPSAVQGESLLPYIDGVADGANRMRVAEYLDFFSFRFDSRWKAIVEIQSDGRLKTWLFDLENDPAEINNLANTEAGAKRLDEMIAKFQQFRAETAADDAHYKGFELGADVSPELAAELDELGYSGFDD
jgi:arylsulfatase A-like enzyme